MTRRSPLLAAAVAAALTLAACGSDGDGSAEAAGTAETVPAADPDLPAAASDLAGQTAVLGAVDLTPVEPGEDHGAHAPGLALEVTGVGYVPTIPVDAYEDLTGERVRASGDEEPPTEVRPADGHVFAVATYETRDPEWEPRGDEPRTTGHLRVLGSETDRLFRTDYDGSRHAGTIVVSLPESHDPEDAVIELETHDAFQAVSLVDGTRVSSDVEHAYPGPVDVTVESAEKLDASFDHWINGHATVQAEVVGGFATPYLDRSRGQGDGWAAPGQRYVGVEVDWHITENTPPAETTIRAETADGQVFQPINDPSSLVDAYANPAVFQLPLDVDAVTVVLESAYPNGVTSGAETIEFDPVSAELTIG